MGKKRKLAASRYQDAYESKDKGGVSRQSFMDWGKLGGLKFFEVQKGVYKINIIPFEIKTKLNPVAHSGKLEIGDLDFALDVWVHRYIGEAKTDILCPKKNYGKHCPICDMVSQYYDQGKEDEAKNLKATRRAIFLVQPIVKGEGPGELQVFEVSHFLFMKELIQEANACEDGEGIVPFADPEEGKVVKFRVEIESLGENKYPKYKSFAFQDRREEIDDEIFDDAPSLDEHLILLSAEKIEAILYGRENEEEIEAPTPKKEKKAKPEPEEDEEEEVPVKTKTAPKSKSDECPHGHTFGKDHDAHKDCQKCKIWDECEEVHDDL